KDQLAAIGELRLYATDGNGQLQTFVWLKNDGTIELGGNTDNAVRYLPLNTALQGQVTDINAELVKIQTAITGLGGAYAHTPVSIDISGAKIEEIKTL